MTRKQCVDLVYKRAHRRCERCGHPIRNSGHPDCVGHVNEKIPRSKGGNPRDPDNCELVCHACHFPNGAHAPTKERQQRLLEGKVFLG